MPDSLRRLVDAADRERARPHRIDPDRLVLAPRGLASTRRVCLVCRRTPDYEARRAQWLKDHPLPKRYCRSGRWCRHLFTTAAEHRAWHEGVFVSSTMPALKELTECPFCAGQIVEVTL